MKQGYYRYKDGELIRTLLADLRFVGDGKHAILLHDLAYVDAKGGIHWAFTGMPTDGMTNPRILWRAVGAPFATKALVACLIHDSDCLLAMAMPPGEGRDIFRRRADETFKEGVDFLVGFFAYDEIVYSGVRIGAELSEDDAMIPSYIEDPEGLYKKMGIPFPVYEDIVDEIFRKEG